MKFSCLVPLVLSCLIVVCSMIEPTTAASDNQYHHRHHNHQQHNAVVVRNHHQHTKDDDVTMPRGGSLSTVVKTPRRTTTMEDWDKKGRSRMTERRRRSQDVAKQVINKNARSQLAETATTALTEPGKTKPKQQQSVIPLWEQKEALMGVLVLTLLERGINKIFVEQAIQFPAQLAGCIGLFVALLVADGIHPGLGESIYDRLLPGSNLLAKWFPVLFVPGLVMLPLAPSIGNGLEVAKFISVAVVGLVYSLLTTAYTVLFLRSFQGQQAVTTMRPTTTNSARPVTTIQQLVPKGIIRQWNRPTLSSSSSVTKTSPSTTNKPYRDETMSLLLKMTIGSGIVSILATNAGNEFQQQVRTIFFFCTTFCSYVWGARLPVSITKIVHPLIVSAMITLGIIQGTSYATSESFLTALKSYKVGTYDFTICGAADIMMFLLGPSVVSFAMSMYNRRKLLKDNLIIVLLSMLVSSAGGLFGTAIFVRLIALGGKYGGGMIRLSTLARNVTTALAIACTNVLQGDVSLAVLIVVMTGVLGATYGRTILDRLGIHDPITRGLAVGGAAQGLGVTSMMSEPDAFPFAAMSMILTAISATVLVSIPPIQQALINLCQGNL